MIKRQEYKSKVKSHIGKYIIELRREDRGRGNTWKTDDWEFCRTDEVYQSKDPKKANKNLKQSQYDFIPRHFTIKLPSIKKGNIQSSQREMSGYFKRSNSWLLTSQS